MHILPFDLRSQQKRQRRTRLKLSCAKSAHTFTPHMHAHACRRAIAHSHTHAPHVGHKQDVASSVASDVVNFSMAWSFTFFGKELKDVNVVPRTHQDARACVHAHAHAHAHPHTPRQLAPDEQPDAKRAPRAHVLQIPPQMSPQLLLGRCQLLPCTLR